MNLKQTYLHDATNTGLNVGSFAGSPSSLEDGDLFYDSTANQLKTRINGATVSVATPGGSDTQIQFNDGGAFGGVAGLVFNKNTNYITLSGGYIINAAAATIGNFVFRQNSVDKGQVAVVGATNDYATGTAVGDLAFYATTGGSLWFVPNGIGASPAWKLSSTGMSSTSGAAIFTSAPVMNSAAGASANFVLRINSVDKGQFAAAGAINDYFTGTAAGDLLIYGVSGTSVFIAPHAGGVHWKFGTTGVITVSNGVLETAGSMKTGTPSGGTAAAFKVGVAASVSPTAPNRTIQIDIAGTLYYLHAKTTND